MQINGEPFMFHRTLEMLNLLRRLALVAILYGDGLFGGL